LDESKGPIKVFVSSPGGEEATGFAIFDTLRMCRNQVETHGFGGVYSIAALIFQAGNVRYLAPNADLMMHNGSLEIGTEGYMDTDKLERLGREAIVNNARYHNAIADRCELEKSVVAGWCREETHFSALHAVDNGLADRLIEPEDI
jgi:ATP-dependent Clp protease protease subunit